LRRECGLVFAGCQEVFYNNFAERIDLILIKTEFVGKRNDVFLDLFFN
jgi:hypothetical protein